MNFPNDFDAETKPIDPTGFGPKGHEAIQALDDRGYEVHSGLTEERARQIITMALEPSIREYCPNDSDKRFKDLAAVQGWLSKRRGTFLLLKRNDGDLSLVGYGWVGAGTSDHVPDGAATFAIRVGEAGQGQGLGTPFAQAIVSGGALVYGAKNIWLETWQSNGGAVHIYHKIGFVDVDSQTDTRPSAGGEIEDTRLYMSLDNDLLLT